MAAARLKTLLTSRLRSAFPHVGERPAAAQGAFHYAIDQLAIFANHASIAGWAFDTGCRVVGIELTSGSTAVPAPWQGLPSDDVVRVHGPAAARSRFACLLPFRPDPAPVLTFVLDDGRRIEVADIRGPTVAADPYHQLVDSFFGGLLGRGRLDILELGSRARSNITRRHMLPADCAYTGVDIVAGENVDLVGDAHDLAAILPPAHFDVVFCMSVFEHLIMPWKAVLEVNRVLRPGGLFFITTHQCFPLHDTPWDFFRFSDRAWPGLFNDATGFRIRQTALGEPASVVAHMTHSVVAGLEAMPAYIASAVLAEKIAETDLRWPVAAAPLVQGWYPG